MAKDSGDSPKKIKSDEDRRLGKAIKRRFWTIVIGCTMLFSGYYAFVILQSSIHIENGLGSKITTITYATQISMNFLLAPFIIRLIGVKKSLLVAESAYIVYVIANAFTNETLLIIGAVTAGIAESLFWIPASISFVYFAKKYHPYSARSEEVCIIEFSGIFFGMLQFNQVLANILITVVLTLLNSSHDGPNPNLTNSSDTYAFNSSEFSNVSSTFAPEDYLRTTDPSFGTNDNPLQFCGANDCQDQEILDESIEQYVPTNPVALYVLTGFFILLMICGIISHFFLVPEMPFSAFNQTSGSKDSSDEELKDDLGLSNKTVKSVLLLSFNATKDLLMKFFHPYQLFFATPYTIYNGINLAMILSEATRAYAACVLGVNQIGICIAIYAFTAATHCFLIGKVLGRYGIVPLIVFQLIYDVCLYTFLLLWIPTTDSSGVVYLLFVLLGIYNGNSLLTATNIYGGKFYESKEVAYSLWNITFGAGFAMMYGISTLLCVREKIYIALGWIIIGAILIGIFQTRLIKNIPDPETNQEGVKEVQESDGNQNHSSTIPIA